MLASPVLSYGIALVCFAVAVLYLLKDGVKVEKMAMWTSIFALATFATVSKIQCLFAVQFRNLHRVSVYRHVAGVACPAGGHSICRMAAGFSRGTAHQLPLFRMSLTSIKNNEKAKGWGQQISLVGDDRSGCWCRRRSYIS